jgi:DNA polymerase-3 subunit epsilon
MDWTEATWEDTPYVSMDFETTGFSRSARIVEVGLVLAKAGEVLHTFQSYINPGIPIPEEATQVHGITDDMVSGAPALSDILSELFTVLDSGPWVSHNLPFDARLLRQSLNPGELVYWSRGVPVFCSLEAAKKRWPKDNRLSAIASKLGIEYEDAELHGALNDAKLLARVVPHLFSGPITDGFSKTSEMML